MSPCSNKALTPQQIQAHYLNSTYLAIVSSGTNVLITWATGALQSATNVNGPYADVNGATSPYTDSVSGTGRFYRARVDNDSDGPGFIGQGWREKTTPPAAK